MQENDEKKEEEMGGAEKEVEKKRRQKGKKAEKGTRDTEVRKSSRTVSLNLLSPDGGWGPRAHRVSA